MELPLCNWRTLVVIVSIYLPHFCDTACKSVIQRLATTVRCEESWTSCSEQLPSQCGYGTGSIVDSVTLYSVNDTMCTDIAAMSTSLENVPQKCTLETNLPGSASDKHLCGYSQGAWFLDECGFHLVKEIKHHCIPLSFKVDDRGIDVAYSHFVSQPSQEKIVENKSAVILESHEGLFISNKPSSDWNLNITAADVNGVNTTQVECLVIIHKHNEVLIGGKLFVMSEPYDGQYSCIILEDQSSSLLHLCNNATSHSHIIPCAEMDRIYRVKYTGPEFTKFVLPLYSNDSTGFRIECGESIQTSPGLNSTTMSTTIETSSQFTDMTTSSTPPSLATTTSPPSTEFTETTTAKSTSRTISTTALTAFVKSTTLPTVVTKITTEVTERNSTFTSSELSTVLTDSTRGPETEAAAFSYITELSEMTGSTRLPLEGNDGATDLQIKHATNTVTIVCAVLGGIVLVVCAIIVVILIVIRRRKRQKEEPIYHEASCSTFLNPTYTEVHGTQNIKPSEPQYYNVKPAVEKAIRDRPVDVSELYAVPNKPRSVKSEHKKRKSGINQDNYPDENRSGMVSIQNPAFVDEVFMLENDLYSKGE